MYLNSTNASRQSGSTEKGVVVKSTRIQFLFLVIMKTLLILVELLTVTV
jgi:hypothetical protein